MQKNFNKESGGNYISMEEGTVAEKTSFVENLNRLIAHINHVCVYSNSGNYVEGVKQLDAMLEAYKDQKFYDDYDDMISKLNVKSKQYSQEDKALWYEENSSEIARLLFKLLMRLMSRSGLSPTGRIAAIDAG